MVEERQRKGEGRKTYKASYWGTEPTFPSNASEFALQTISYKVGPNDTAKKKMSEGGGMIERQEEFSWRGKE